MSMSITGTLRLAEVRLNGLQSVSRNRVHEPAEGNDGRGPAAPAARAAAVDGRQSFGLPFADHDGAGLWNRQGGGKGRRGKAREGCKPDSSVRYIAVFAEIGSAQEPFHRVCI